MWVVSGASGFVGSAVLARLRKVGVEAAGIYRRRQDGGGRLVERWDRATLRAALDGAEGVIHSAAVVHRPGADSRFNVEGTRALLDAAQDVGVRHFVFCSSIKVYGERPSGTLDERTPLAPEGPYASSKAEAERLVLEGTGMRVAVLRLCPVYGPGDKGNVRTIIRAVQRRLFFVPGDGSTRKSIVHVSTVADTVAALARSDASGTFVVADREAPSLRELADAAAGALGRRRPPSLPLPALRAGARLAGAAARLAGRSTSFSLEQVEKAVTTTVCDPSRVERALGIDCHVDLDGAIREEVSWLRSIGAL